MTELDKGIHVAGQGPAIVMLHSSLSSAKQWLPLVHDLKAHYKIINFDLLGYGDAPRVIDSINYNFSVELVRIKAALEQIIPHESYHIVGHSCGGAVALKLAVEDPTHVLSLSLYEPVAFHLLAPKSNDWIEAHEFAKSLELDDLHIAAEKFTDYWNEKDFFKKLPKRIQPLLANEMIKVHLDFIGLTSETYGAKEISKITSPVLMMTGRNSPKLSVNLANLICSYLSNVHEVSFNTGHMGPISCADVIQSEIAKFIKRVHGV